LRAVAAAQRKTEASLQALIESLRGWHQWPRERQNPSAVSDSAFWVAPGRRCR
jgi:hypothetical protein